MQPSATVQGSPETALAAAALGGTTVPEEIMPSATIDQALRQTVQPETQAPLPPL